MICRKGQLRFQNDCSRAVAAYSVILFAMSLGSLSPLSWNFISPRSKHRSSGFLSSFNRIQFLWPLSTFITWLGSMDFCPPPRLYLISFATWMDSTNVLAAWMNSACFPRFSCPTLSHISEVILQIAIPHWLARISQVTKTYANQVWTKERNARDLTVWSPGGARPVGTTGCRSSVMAGLWTLLPCVPVAFSGSWGFSCMSSRVVRSFFSASPVWSYKFRKCYFRRG